MSKLQHAPYFSDHDQQTASNSQPLYKEQHNRCLTPESLSCDLCVNLYLDRKRGGKTELGLCTERKIIPAANLDGNNINILKLLVSWIFANTV
jgi:hypothetical protein